MQELASMSEPELRALRGDKYQERENAQAVIQGVNQAIMAINQRLAQLDKQPGGDPAAEE